MSAATLLDAGLQWTFPASYAQERVWLDSRLDPSSPAHNVPCRLRLPVGLTAAQASAALTEVVARHEALRAHLRIEGAALVQVLQTAKPLQLQVVDLGELAAGEQESRVEALAAELAATPFELGAPPLWRARLVRHDSAEFSLLFVAHQAVFDGESVALFRDEIIELCRAAVAGRPADLPRPAIRYSDFAAWQRNRLTEAELAADLAYWRDRLAGAPPVTLPPADRPRPAGPDFAADEVRFGLPCGLLNQVEEVAERYDVTPQAVLLTGCAALLARLSGGTDGVVLGVPTSARELPEVPELAVLIGAFGNPVPVYADTTGEPTFAELLGRVSESLEGATAHARTPLQKIAEALVPTPDPAVQPLFQVSFDTWNNAKDRTADAAPVRTARDDLAFEIRPGRSALRYHTALFDRATAESIAARFVRLLVAGVTDPETPVLDLPLLDDAERALLLDTWNATDRPLVPTTLPDLFERQVERTPQATALVAEDATLTYEQLNASANWLAWQLGELGAGPESLVALALPRRSDLVVAMLAVLKAGAGYLPIDLGHPAERIAFVLGDARPALTLTTADARGALPPGTPTLELPGGTAESGAAVTDAERVAPLLPANPAYVIYTSGSTGRPKGVVATHEGLVNQLRWLAAEHPLDGSDLALARTSVTFDASVWELWLPLISGAGVCLAPAEATADPQALMAYADRQGVTTAQFVPSMLPELLDGPRCRSLRTVFCGGEPLPATLAGRVAADWGVSVVNLYGPTETTIQVATAPYSDGHTGIVPIGRPVWNTQAHVLDAGLQPAPIGVPGELFIGGAQLTRGYLNRPGLTADRFVPNPFGPPGSRLYRTGDRCRRRADGAIDFLGRLDHQVKIRGYRIELGEIEASLRTHPAIADVVVLADHDESRLVGYLRAEGRPPGPADLRAHLEKVLPAYMVPAAYRTVAAFPLTPNGKVDHRALREQGDPLSEHTGTEPTTPTGRVLAEIMGRLLKIPPPGADDSFFDLGGHSLLVARLVGEVAARTGVKLSMRELLKRPRVQELADYLDTLREPEAAAPVAAQPADDTGMPASSMQRQMWLAELRDPETTHTVPLLWRITGELDAGRLRTAFGAVIERYEILRTAFVDRAGELHQVVRAPWAPDLVRADLRGRTPSERKAAVDALVDTEAGTAFDVASGRPLRVRLLDCGAGEHLLLVCFHHLVFDAGSIPVFVRDLAHEYARALGRSVPERAEPVQFATVARDQQAQLEGPDGQEGLDHWTGYLTGAPTALDLGKPPASPGPHGAVPVPISADFIERCGPLLDEHRVSWYMVTAAAVAALLHRASGSEDVTFGLPVANREDERHADVLGPCLNTVVLRTKTGRDTTFADLLGQVRESMLDALDYQSVPFPAVLERLDPPRQGGRIPYLDVALAMVANSDAAQEFGPAQLTAVPFERWQHDSKFGITAAFIDTGGQASAVLCYRGDRFAEADVRRMAEWLGRLLEDIVENADLPLAGTLPVAGSQYRDFVLARADGPGAEGVEHWVGALDGAPSYPTLSPPLRLEPPGAVTVELPADALDRLRSVRAEHGVSWFMVAATALAALLHRWTGQDDVTFGCPLADRDEVPDVLGPCLNTVVLRSQCAEQTSVRELLHAMRDTVLDAFEHQSVPLEDIVNRLNPPRRPGWTPYIDVLLAAAAGGSEPLVLGGIELSPLPLDHTGAGYAGKFALTVGFEETGSGLRGTVMYRGDRFSSGEVRRMAGWLGRFVARFGEVLDQPLATLDLVDDGELAEIVEFEQGAPAGPATSVPAMFARRCAERPDAPALRSSRGVLSYRALDERAEALAGVLRPYARGEQPAVALVLPRGEDLVVAMLAAWKAGFLFCPLEPGYPASRIQFILANLEACAVVTDAPGAIEAADPDGVPVVDVANLPGPAPTGPPQATVPDPESTAYVLYTSGTTGEPKGVAYSHRSLAQVTGWHIDEFEVAPGDRISQIHSVAFDMTEYEIWPALCAGAELVPYEPQLVVPELAGWLEEQRITMFFTPTPLAEALWSADARLPDLRWMFFAGSPLTTLPPPAGYQICDAYGPTETYITTTHVLDPDAAAVLNCVGRPTAGVRVYVLDAAGQRCPIGIPGEIHVGGATVAQGYWRRADMTRQRFATFDPDGRPGWVYRTGDKGRWLPDGTLEYLGRLDRQLKIRGYRIEPAEIESHLRRDPLVHQAVVRGFPGEAAPLVAYLVARDGGRADTPAVLDRLKVMLPDFMVPNAVVWLPELPLNSRGKLNADKLPRPGRDDLVGQSTWAAPETDLERRIAGVWCGVLGIESVGVHDNFFDLGGNSLLLAALHSRLTEELAVTLPIRRLFEHPTVHALARALAAGDGAEPAADVVRDRAQLAQRSRARRARPPRSRSARPGDADD